MIAPGMRVSADSDPKVSRVTTSGRVFGDAECASTYTHRRQSVSPTTTTTNRNRIRARPAASAATKRAHMTSAPTTKAHQLFTASQRAGSASQASQLTAYGLGTATAVGDPGGHRHDG